MLPGVCSNTPSGVMKWSYLPGRPVDTGDAPIICHVSSRFRAEIDEERLHVRVAIDQHDILVGDIAVTFFVEPVLQQATVGLLIR